MTTPLIYEGIYLLQTPNHQHNNIYKIGRSNDIYKRISSYDNGTIVHLIISSNNSVLHEKELITIFKNTYHNNTFYGNETFNGNVNHMINNIITYITNNTVFDNNYIITYIHKQIYISTVDKITNTLIPKHQQELYTNTTINTITQANFDYKKAYNDLLNKYNTLLNAKEVANDTDIRTVENVEKVENVANDTDIGTVENVANDITLNNLNISTIIINPVPNTYNIIYPFGYEDINFLSNDEKENILRNSCFVENALNKIYSNPENKNFYKLTQKSTYTHVYDESFTIDITDSKLFTDRILQNIQTILSRILCDVSDKLNFDTKFKYACKINKIWSFNNKRFEIKPTSITMINELYKINLKNNIKKIQNDINKQQHIKNYITEKLNTIEMHKKKFKITTLTKDEINTNLSNDFSIIYYNYSNNVIDKTIFFAQINAIKEQELQYMKSRLNTTIEDLFTYIRSHDHRIFIACLQNNNFSKLAPHNDLKSIYWDMLL